jgi:hypothetical protein
MSCTSPLHTDLWGILYDWQTIIAGILAIVAAAIGARAAYSIGNAQITSAKQKDRLQAKALAVTILPEIIQLRVDHAAAMSIISEDVRKIRSTDANNNVANMVSRATIEVPPVLSRSVEQLYMLQDAGAALIQLYSVITQYNSLIRRIWEKAYMDTSAFNWSDTADDLDKHLLRIRTDMDAGENKLGHHIL